MICQLNILEEHQGLQDYYRALCANIGVRWGSIMHNKVLHDTASKVCVSLTFRVSQTMCLSTKRSYQQQNLIGPWHRSTNIKKKNWNGEKKNEIEK